MPVFLALGIAAAGAQENVGPTLFLPLPSDVPLALFGGLIEPQDPADLAHEIRQSTDASVSSTALPDSLIDIPSGTPAATGEAITLPGETAGTATISVVVENIETPRGTINIGLCDKGLSRETCPYDKEVRSTAGFVQATFEGISPGRYAVVAYHDVNGNGEFDRLLGMPREPYALSGEAGQKLVPRFNDAAVPIFAGDNNVVIRLRRLRGN